ncbi:bifunctional metallophosphatase/5'-nucleotidase [Rhodococcus artemisiae]|uniref:Bifunctional UDP-sugar hydrolase/5'-nucleotidase n=1 Tax=Rhodococcus artemisiae TaxID=714159 RepID=A0ABU7L9S1_9NOCA|nr:bifunctional UDP-sugar hydrolase/5'-nucleotidase [Rhodococcus artemisiae]MEE2058303.1 bifunctional UDP-sugar hydrolase/5'-nucleotidase [Rhodococcus artemisiae]
MGARSALRRALSVVATVAAVVIATAAGQAGAVPPDTAPLRLITFGDLHGNLLPPQGPRSEVVRSDGHSVPAGGAAYLAAYVRQLREQADDSVLYAVGDSWGSSPIESALFHDEPTVEFLNDLDVTAAALGNHEFDNGFAELERLRDGGCHPESGCQFTETFGGATFPFLGANVTTSDGAPAALPFDISYVDGIPVGAIGILPHNTPEYIRHDAIDGLRFGDEIEAVNRTADILDSLGVRSIILLFKGDIASGIDSDPCSLDNGRAKNITSTVSSHVDLIVTSDGDGQFNCSYPDPAGHQRTVLQGASHGRILSVADIAIDRTTRDVVRDRTVAFNQVITHDITPDPRTEDFVARVADKASDTAAREVGRIAADITRDPSASGESALGNLVADAQLAATAPLGAQIALTNPGGLRGDLYYDDGGAITYGEAYGVQPFGNLLQILELTGAQLTAALEQQFQTDVAGADHERILAPSHNLHYTLDRLAPVGQRVRGITVSGAPLDPDAMYSVAVNDYLAGGSDGFSVFAEARSRVGAGEELTALTTFLSNPTPCRPPARDRIHVH